MSDVAPDSEPLLRAVTPVPELKGKPWGVPGEEHKLIVAPIMKGATERPGPSVLRGGPGKYRVQILLSRPLSPIRKEREHKFIDDLVGSSHFTLAKPKEQRAPTDVDSLLIAPIGKNYQITGISNDDGFLGKLVCELQAANSEAAEAEVYGTIGPMLSAWSMNADIPANIETIQVTNMETFVSTLRVVTPHFEMTIPTSAEPLQAEYCQYASIYREGLNSNSAFYRFLCFYKIVESLITKRGREASAKKRAGGDPSRGYEVIPEKDEDIIALLGRLYPWRTTWDAMGFSQIFPAEVRGKKVTAIRDKYFQGLRVGIAHALLDSGEIRVVLDKMENVQAVNKWLPLCRICARWMLLTDFPRECSLGMRA